MADPRTALTDASLVERARRGDEAAFEMLVRRHYRAAYAVALALLGNQLDAEDVCQEGFILDDCEPARFAAWLSRIVRNRAHNYRDYQRVRTAVQLDDTSAASSENSARHVERSELREVLEAALRELTDMQREVVLLHDLEGWKHRAIAEMLGISGGACRQHLFHARRALRDRLGDRVLKEYIHD